MCLGVPLQVREILSPAAVRCAQPGAQVLLREVNTGLLEDAPATGDWLLVHVDVAIRTLSPDEAQQIGDALRAVEAAARGESFEHLIADLIEREPQLPEHLRPADKETYDHG